MSLVAGMGSTTELLEQIESLRQQLADKHLLFMCASANYDRLAEQLAECERERDELLEARSISNTPLDHHATPDLYGTSRIEAFYKSAYNKAIEDAAKLCSGTTNEAFMTTLWTLENSIRALEMK